MTSLALALALSCLWDSDTFAEEALRQQDVAQVVRGHIVKHSAFFYEEKVKYTQPLVDAGTASAERYDDLAVALEKLGRHDDALAVMAKKEERFPSQYTTLANRGTFHAHKGEYKQALELLRAAIALNPDAHFGREKYQVKALEYLLALERDPKLATQKDLLGVALDPERLMFGDKGRRPKKGEKTAFDESGLARDVFVGLAGIIRFGGGDQSSHVWLSLGVASALDGDRQLAIRAFARAHELGHPKAKVLAEHLAMTLREFDGKLDLERLRKEYAAGQAEVKALQAAEDDKLRAGRAKQVFGY